MIKLVFFLIMLISTTAFAQRQQLAPFEDQLYMIARAQEQRIQELEQQVQELKRQLDQAKDPPPEEKK